MSRSNNIIPFPLRTRKGLTELEILEGTLVAVLGRLDDLDELDGESIESVLSTLSTVVEWLERRAIDPS